MSRFWFYYAAVVLVICNSLWIWLLIGEIKQWWRRR